MERKIERKNGCILIQETEFKEKHYIDIRQFYLDKDGEFKPTQKGISLTYKEFSKFLKILKEMKNDEQFLENYENYKSESGD